MITKLEDLQRKMLDSAEAFKAFADVQKQVDALGMSFGQTSIGMEAYTQKANQLGLTAQQTVTSLQRITEALANQTYQGQQLRQMIQQYGVDLRNLRIDQADQALQSFAERIRTVADSAGKFQAIQSILGPLDADSYGHLNNPTYVSIDERRDRALQSAYNRQASTTSRDVAIRAGNTLRDDSEYQDLKGQFGSTFGGPNIASDMRAEVLKSASLKPDDNLRSQNSQLAIYRFYQNNPNSRAAVLAQNIGPEISGILNGTSGYYKRGTVSGGGTASSKADASAVRSSGSSPASARPRWARCRPASRHQQAGRSGVVASLVQGFGPVHGVGGVRHRPGLREAPWLRKSWQRTDRMAAIF